MQTQIFTIAHGRQLGTLELSESGASIQYQDPETERDNRQNFAWDLLEIKYGGAANKLVFFTPKEPHPSIESFYIDRTKDYIQQLKQVQHPVAQEFVKSHQTKSLIDNGMLLTVLGGLVAFLLALYFFSSPILGHLSSYIPYSVEKQIGEKLLGVILPPNKQVTKEEVVEELRAEVRKLLPQLPKEMQDVGIYISNDSNINAFALPGGNIVFNVGMLKKANSIEEVMGVAAHELAHVRGRHVLKGLIQTLGVYFLVDLFLGDVTGIIAVLTSNSEMLLQRGFSRTQETEADEIGFDMLVALKIDPQGMVDFFNAILEEQKKMEESAIGQYQKYLSFLSTHPDTLDRIEAIKKRREEVLKTQNFNTINFDYEAFRKKIKDL